MRTDAADMKAAMVDVCSNFVVPFAPSSVYGALMRIEQVSFGVSSVAHICRTSALSKVRFFCQTSNAKNLQMHKF